MSLQRFGWLWTCDFCGASHELKTTESHSPFRSDVTFERAWAVGMALGWRPMINGWQACPECAPKQTPTCGLAPRHGTNAAREALVQLAIENDQLRAQLAFERTRTGAGGMA